MTEHIIEPYEETPIPGTALTVYHQGYEEAYVHVHDDGRIELGGPFDWFVWVGKDTGQRTTDAISEARS